jgi:hypothetical protein
MTWWFGVVHTLLTSEFFVFSSLIKKISQWAPGGGGCFPKRPLGRLRRRWEDNIKMDLRNIGIDGANWILLDQDRVQWRAFVRTVINFRVP